MKLLFILFTCIIFGCNSAEEQTSEKTDSVVNETAKDSHVPVTSIDTSKIDETEINGISLDSTTPSKKVYANKRFKDVTVERIEGNKFRIKGKGQIFEASFSWVIEDGHNELKKGYETTDAGAPEWGNFDFVVEAKKARQNSTLHLIIFETSAKDGSRQYELPIKLY